MIVCSLFVSSQMHQPPGEKYCLSLASSPPEESGLGTRLGWLKVSPEHRSVGSGVDDGRCPATPNILMAAFRSAGLFVVTAIVKFKLSSTRNRPTPYPAHRHADDRAMIPLPR